MLLDMTETTPPPPKFLVKCVLSQPFWQSVTFFSHPTPIPRLGSIGPQGPVSGCLTKTETPYVPCCSIPESLSKVVIICQSCQYQFKYFSNYLVLW